MLLGLIILRTETPIAVLPVVAVVTGYPELAGLSTPDTMACFFSLLGIYSLLTKRKLVFLVAAALPLIRTDFILLSGLLMIYTYFTVNRFLSLLSILLSVAFYILVNRLNGNYGYLTIFNFSFISGPIPYPADIVISHKVTDYLEPYMMVTGDLITHSYGIILVLSLYVLSLKRAVIKYGVDFYCLFALPFVFMTAHLLLFPSMEYRFLVFSASLIFVWSLGLLKALREAAQPPVNMDAARGA